MFRQASSSTKKKKYGCMQLCDEAVHGTERFSQVGMNCKKT